MHNLVFETTYAPEIAAFTPPQPLRSTNGPSRSPQSVLMGGGGGGGGNGGGNHSGGPRHAATKSTSTVQNGAITEEATVVQPVSLRQGRGPRLSFLGGRKKDQQASKEVNGDNHHHQPIQEEPEPAATTNGNNNNNTSSSAPKEQQPKRSLFRTLPYIATADAGSASARERAGGSHSAHTNGTDYLTYPHSSTTIGSDARGSEPNSAVTTPGGGMVGGDKDGYSSAKSFDGPYGGGGGGGQTQTQTQTQHTGGGGHSSLGHSVGSVRKRLSMLKLGKKSSRERSAGGLGGVDEEQ